MTGAAFHVTLWVPEIEAGTIYRAASWHVPAPVFSQTLLRDNPLLATVLFEDHKAQHIGWRGRCRQRSGGLGIRADRAGARVIIRTCNIGNFIQPDIVIIGIRHVVRSGIASLHGARVDEYALRTF